MKKILTVTTRWEYYVSNAVGFIVIVSLIIWFVKLSFKGEVIEFSSVFFWLAIVLLLAIPFAIISFLSSMKSVVVTKNGLLISYSFKRHTSSVDFSDVKEFKSNASVSKTMGQSSGLRDSFRLTVADGRVFEFSQSQFDNYPKFKSIVYKAVADK